MHAKWLTAHAFVALPALSFVLWLYIVANMQGVLSSQNLTMACELSEGVHLYINMLLE